MRFPQNEIAVSYPDFAKEKLLIIHPIADCCESDQDDQIAKTKVFGANHPQNFEQVFQMQICDDHLLFWNLQLADVLFHGEKRRKVKSVLLPKVSIALLPAHRILKPIDLCIKIASS